METHIEQKELFLRHHAGQVYGFGYSIWKDGKVYPVVSVQQTKIKIGTDVNHLNIPFTQIGTSAFILCRPYSDLVKDIPGIGVPLVELSGWNVIADLVKCYKDREHYIARFETKEKEPFEYKIASDMTTLKLHEAEILRTWHFPVGLQESWIKYIE